MTKSRYAALALALLAGPIPQAEPVYEVYAVRYATYPGFPLRGLVAGADSARKIDIAMTVWVVQGGGHTMLVDAGFYRDKFVHPAPGRGLGPPADYVLPSEAIRPLGLKPEDVTDVIISHIHWDHVDGADLFPKARVWLQQAEYEYYVGTDGKALHGAIDSLDAAMLARLKAQGRVILIAGDSQAVVPGVRVYTGGKHTFASEYVGVHTKSGTTIIASDNCYLYENLDKRRPIAQTLDSVSNLAAQDRMRRLASTLRLVVPGHDPAVFERFPAPGRGIARID
jgi:glyoxylase-like metal-dependent hydrolase (beta-lactamase superfamily II)